MVFTLSQMLSTNNCLATKFLSRNKTKMFLFLDKGQVTENWRQSGNRIYVFKKTLSHDVAPGSDITSCNKIDKPLVVYRFSNVT